MRKSYILAAIIPVLLFQWSCSKDSGLGAEDSGIRVEVSAPGLQTKATKDGEDQFNENGIYSYYFFFYPLGQTDVKPTIQGFKSDLGGVKTDDYTMPTSTTLVNNVLFAKPNRQCQVFVVANPPTSLVPTLTGSPTLATLRAATVKSSLSGIQSSFLMVYDSKAELISRTAELAVKVEAKMHRLASKITVQASFIDSYVDPETEFVWEPEKDKLKAWFVNGMSRTALSGNFADSGAEESDWFESEEGSFCVSDGNYLSSRPFYTYPMEWEYTSKHEPYLLFELPWECVTEGHQEFKPSYYKMVLGNKEIPFNTWYFIAVNLNTMGSFNREDPTQEFLREAYIVQDWTNAFDEDQAINNVNADIRNACYLVVSESEIDLDNIDKRDIAFTTSHDVEIKSASYKRSNYYANGKWNTDTQGTDCRSWFGIDNENKLISFSHSINNDIESGSLDTVPYEITLVVGHKGTDSYNETVTITQAPAITVSYEENDAYGTANTGLGTRGDVYVNGQSRNILGSTAYYNTVRTRTSNCYLYTIEVKSLPSGTSYIITDPRVGAGHENQIWDPISTNSSYHTWVSVLPGSSPDNVGIASSNATSGTNLPGSADGTALYGTNTRKMTYYYATQTTEESENYIAPKFTIASNFCSAGTINEYTWYHSMVRRCATYQEAGRPAGRWRLPTYSEIMFVANLQHNGLIPAVFTAGGYGGGYGGGYYCATTGVGINDNSYEVKEVPFEGGTRSIRCVYDDWYWENSDARVQNGSTEDGRLPESKWNQFTWGDMPKE